MGQRRLLLVLLLPAIIVTAFVGLTPMFALINYALQTPFEDEKRIRRRASL